MSIGVGTGYWNVRINVWTATLGLLLSGCSASTAGGPAGAIAPSKLVVTGSSTLAPLLAEIAVRYEQTYPGVRIDVQTGGSSRGIADVRNGTADIGMVSRQLKSDELDLVATTLARDGICPIIHRDNPVRRITDEQIRRIYRGELRNWAQLGGADAPITVVHKAEGRSTLELFLAYYRLQSAEVEASIIIGDNEQGIKTVAGNPHAIGYVSIGAAEYSVDRGVPIGLLPVAGVTPSTAAVERGTFPLSRSLVLVTRGEPRGIAAEFITYACSPAVADLVEGFSFVPAD